MNKQILLLLTLLFPTFATSQTNNAISGYIKDAQTGEFLIGANITIPKEDKGTISNAYGFYSINSTAQQVLLQASYIGYQEKELEIELTKDTIFTIFLEPSLFLDEVVVKSEVATEKTIGVTTISPKEIKQIPMIGGEQDVLKAIQLLPGVKSGTENSAGIYVRGGGADQNLILLDGIPLYNVSHLFGFVSSFNPDAINSINFYKGGFPARYGGRLSSVLDVRMKNGNVQQLEGAGTIGLVASKFSLNGPIKKGKSTFLISTRRSLFDAVTRIGNLFDNDQGNYHFSDINAKLNFMLSETESIAISTYWGVDKFVSKSDFDDGNYRSIYENTFGWGNTIANIRWNKSLNASTFLSATAYLNRYQFQTGTYTDITQRIDNEEFKFKSDYDYQSAIRDYGLDIWLDYRLNTSHNLKFGSNYIYHTFLPGVNVQRIATDTIQTFEPPKKSIQAHEIRLWAEDEWKWKRWIANIGLHSSFFRVNQKNYTSLEPRLALNYSASEKLQVKAAYVQMQQYLHLLTNSSLGLPTDLWVPPTENVRPQQAWQSSFGLSYLFKKQWAFSSELYYKEMKGLINYKEGASFLIDGNDWEDKIVTNGTGKSYGGELLMRKTKGKTTGWIAYTLSWTNRQFEALNNGERFPYKYDRRHDFSIVIQHQIRKNINFNINWVFQTGNAITFPEAIYPDPNFPPNLAAQSSFLGTDLFEIPLPGTANTYIPQNLVFVYDGVNKFRMPAYHRLDIGINFIKEKKWGKRTWSINAYNAYSRRNPFYLTYGYDLDNSLDLENAVGKVKVATLFPIIPSISYHFEF